MRISALGNFVLVMQKKKFFCSQIYTLGLKQFGFKKEIQQN